MSAYCCIELDLLLTLNHDARNHEFKNPPTCFGHSCGHLQGGDTEQKKLKHDTIIEVTEPIQGIK